MGEPVRIYELACNLVRLSGLSVRDDKQPNGDIEIVTVGLRPGEKLYEELLIGDNPMPTRHPRVMMASEPFLAWTELRPKLKWMATLIEANDITGACNLLSELVPEYAPASDSVDLVHVAQFKNRDSAATLSPRHDCNGSQRAALPASETFAHSDRP
jgi:FlaA1/EpsC-like NDP-sugar epimerase